MENPLVTIGIPLYNEGNHIFKTLESAVNQGYGNVEIIISDNCSTDGSIELIREIVQQNDNVRLIKHLTNIGVIDNFNFLKQEAKGEYFMWLGGHDIISPIYIEKCLALFANNEKLILVYSKAKFFSENLEDVRNTDASVDLKTVGLGKVKRGMKILNPALCTAIHGLFRVEHIKYKSLKNISLGPDNVFLFELALLGEFGEVDQYLYYRREVRKKETTEERLERYKEFYKLQSDAPHDSLKLEHFKAIRRSKLSIKEKVVLNTQVFDVFLKGFFSSKEFMNSLLSVCDNAKDRFMFRKIAMQHKLLKSLYKLKR